MTENRANKGRWSRLVLPGPLIGALVIVSCAWCARSGHVKTAIALGLLIAFWAGAASVILAIGLSLYRDPEGLQSLASRSVAKKRARQAGKRAEEATLRAYQEHRT